MLQHTSFLSLGSSQGDKLLFLQQALVLIRGLCGKTERISPVYETEPWGFETKETFLNIAVELKTGLSPKDLIKTILQIEKQMGRIRKKSKGYSGRTIDIDILFYDDIELSVPGLTLPHPHAHERRFVLQPMCDIAPEFVHPVLRTGISQLLQECSDTCVVSKTKLMIDLPSSPN